MNHKLKKIVLLLSLTVSMGVAVNIAVQKAQAEKVEVGMEQSKQLFEDLNRWNQSNEQVEQEKEAHAYYVERQQVAQASKRAEEKETARLKAEQEAAFRAEQEMQATAEQERLAEAKEAPAESEAEVSTETPAQQATESVDTFSDVDASTTAVPALVAPVIGVSKIGINGIYKNYVSIGFADTETIQSVIDTGAITAALTYFSGMDGQSTYFGGHNPGVMNFMENNATIGSVITVTDANGAVFEYLLTDRVQTDTSGEAVFGTIGMSAVDAYGYGTGVESILIQYCNSYDSLMTMWYGVLL
jgi:hypothetical protein